MNFFEVENISKRFGYLKAVDKVSFEVSKGEIFTIIGPNGAGKTTIFNLISLIYPLSGGRIVLDGQDLTGMASHRLGAAGVGRTFQNIELFEHATVLQNLLVGCHAHGRTNFAVLHHAGSALNIAAMPLLFERNVINFMPASGSRAMFDPPDRLKIAMTSPYFDQIEVGLPVPHQAEEGHQGLRDLPGRRIRPGAPARRRGRPQEGQPGTHRSSHLQAGLDRLLVAGRQDQAGRLHVGGARCTVARDDRHPRRGAQERLQPRLHCGRIGESSYTAQLAELGGAAVENLYAVHAVNTPYADDSSKAMRDFYAAYKARFNEGPQQISMYSYYVVDVFAKAAAKAGPNLTTDSFLNVMETTTFPNVFGGANFSISKTDRLGIRELRVSQVQKGRWVNVSELLSAR